MKMILYMVLSGTVPSIVFSQWGMLPSISVSPFFRPQQPTYRQYGVSPYYSGGQQASSQAYGYGSVPQISNTFPMSLLPGTHSQTIQPGFQHSVHPIMSSSDAFDSGAGGTYELSPGALANHYATRIQPYGSPMSSYPSQPVLSGVTNVRGDYGLPLAAPQQPNFQYDATVDSTLTNSIVQPPPPPPSPQQATGPRRIVPPYLQGASKEQEDQFYAIVQHPTLSPTEKQQRIEEFVRQLDANRQARYASFKQETAQSQNDKRQRVHQLVERMSPEAQTQFQKVSALMTQPGLTPDERLRQIQSLYDRIPSSIKAEFDQHFKNL